MTDLTVLISPIAIPLYPHSANQSSPFLNFGRGNRNFSHPYNRSSAALNAERGGGDGRTSGAIMVTLETEVDEATSATKVEELDLNSPVPNSRPVPRGRQPARPQFDESFLSPPPNTGRARSRPSRGHRSTRSQSAPPSKTEFQQSKEAVEEEKESQEQRQDPTINWVEVPYDVAPPSSYIPFQRGPKRSFTAFSSDLGASTRGGELIRPPPPLLRPTTFWRKTRKSGVSAASFSPSSHLIRRSTFIAAGLSFDAPIHDLSAYCVESRVGCVVVPPEQQLQ